MIIYHNKSISQRKEVSGDGLLNSIINKLPFELHLPGYEYCGPGTKLKQRLVRGDQGINPLDRACKEHDIAYSINNNIEDRHIADKKLSEKAWHRVKSADATLGERVNSLIVTGIMKLKTKLGAGIKLKKKQNNRLNKRNVRPLKVAFRNIVKNVKDSLASKAPVNLTDSIGLALTAAKKAIGRKKKAIKTPRIIPIPKKIGGVLPFLIPLFAGLSAIGALSGGAAGIAKAVSEAKAAKTELDENKRHNKKMEAIAIGHGLFLKPYRAGLGLYLSPSPKNF